MYLSFGVGICSLTYVSSCFPSPGSVTPRKTRQIDAPWVARSSCRFKKDLRRMSLLAGSNSSGYIIAGGEEHGFIVLAMMVGSISYIQLCYLVDLGLTFTNPYESG